MEEPVYDASRPMPEISLIYAYKLPNGLTNVGLRVDFQPNASTPPHRHGTCCVSAYVVSGALLNKMNNDPMKLIESGGTWYEAPGCHHRISNNASETEPAVLIANMILATELYDRDGMEALFQIDPEYR